MSHTVPSNISIQFGRIICLAVYTVRAKCTISYKNNKGPKAVHGELLVKVAPFSPTVISYVKPLCCSELNRASGAGAPLC